MGDEEDEEEDIKFEEEIVFPRLLPDLSERRTSLADIYKHTRCGFAVASLPEYGHDRHGNFAGGFSAPVMRIIEELPAYLKDGVAFMNLVDFAGSTSGRFCSSRIRYVHEDGSVVHCDNDFDRNLSKAFPKANWDEPFRMAKNVEHSAWLCYWRGKVSGGLTSAFGAMSDTAVPPALKVAGCLCNSFESQPAVGSEEFEYYKPLLDAHAPAFVNFKDELYGVGRGTDKVRIVVVLSVDGGPITQVEKRMIPEVLRNTISDLRRRKNVWAGHCRLVWVHFASVSDILDSMAGKRNLTVDTQTSNCFGVDDLDVPLTYMFVDDSSRDSSPPVPPMPNWGMQPDEEYLRSRKTEVPELSLLTKSVEDILSQAKNTGVSIENFKMCCKNNDIETFKFIISRDPTMLTTKVEVKGEDEPQPPLYLACKFGSVHVVHTFCNSVSIVGAKSKANGIYIRSTDKTKYVHMGTPDKASIQWESCTWVLYYDGKIVASKTDIEKSAELTSLPEGPFEEGDGATDIKVVRPAGLSATDEKEGTWDWLYAGMGIGCVGGAAGLATARLLTANGYKLSEGFANDIEVSNEQYKNGGGRNLLLTHRSGHAQKSLWQCYDQIVSLSTASDRVSRVFEACVACDEFADGTTRVTDLKEALSAIGLGHAEKVLDEYSAAHCSPSKERIDYASFCNHLEALPDEEVY